METIKLKIHSMVDIITNSSTTIYTYQQGSVIPAKELINEILKLSGENEKTADDVFYFGVFADDYIYLESEEIDEVDHPRLTADYGTDEYKVQNKKLDDWFYNLKESIIKGEIEKPQWMKNAEQNDYGYNPDMILEIIVKDEKYSDLASKILTFLNSQECDGGRDG